MSLRFLKCLNMLRLVIFMKLVLRLRIFSLGSLCNIERLEFFSFLKIYFLICRIFKFFNEESECGKVIDVW